MIAALFVAPPGRGSYHGIEGVDPWWLHSRDGDDPDIDPVLPGFEQHGGRDARDYAGPYPVVAHPPCSRWCRLAGLVASRWGHHRGLDGGCFASALQCVRIFGGVLEHPAYSDAWEAFGLHKPTTGGQWERCDNFGGSTCYVEQWRYGHAAKKATWLYACGVELHEMQWGHEKDQKQSALVSWCENKVANGEIRPRLGKTAASATPIAFRDALIAIARSCKRTQ